MFLRCVQTESTGSFLSMNEMQKGGEIPEGGAKDETENVRTQEREEDDGERVREKGGEGRIDSRIFT